MIKHSRDYTAAHYPTLTPYFLDLRPPLEAQVIDLADEIAYLTADLDDGLESGLLEINHIRQHVSLFERCFTMVERMHPGTSEKYLFNEALQWMQNTLTEDLAANTAANVAAAGARSLDDIRRHPSRLALFSPSMEKLRLEEKRYLYDTLYSCPHLTLEHDKAEEVVKELFDLWIDAPEELPQGYIDEISEQGLARVVADYLAGMTDTYILEQYAHIKRAVRQ